MPVVPLDPSSPRVFEAVSVPLSSVEVRDEAVEAVWSRYTEGRRALLGRWADSVPVTAADLFFMESALLKQHPQFPACPLTLRFAAAGGDGPAACHPGYTGDPLALDPAAPPAGLIPGPLSAEVLVADRDAPALNWMPVCGCPAA